MRNVGHIILIFFFLSACAKVNVETKKPIRVDINMRVDVYQHLLKDVEAIESEVYGKEKKKLNGIFSLKKVYAAEYSSVVEEAIKRRKERSSKLKEYFDQGIIGENKEAYIEIVKEDFPSVMREKIVKLVEEENKDREMIYKATAEKNGVTVSQVEKVFFQTHYKRAPQGYLFEVYDEKKGKYVWKKK